MSICSSSLSDLPFRSPCSIFPHLGSSTNSILTGLNKDQKEMKEWELPWCKLESDCKCADAKERLKNWSNIKYVLVVFLNGMSHD